MQSLDDFGPRAPVTTLYVCPWHKGEVTKDGKRFIHDVMHRFDTTKKIEILMFSTCLSCRDNFKFDIMSNQYEDMEKNKVRELILSNDLYKRMLYNVILDKTTWVEYLRTTEKSRERYILDRDFI